MNKTIVYIALLILHLPAYGQKQIELKSPNGKISVAISISRKIHYSVSAEGRMLMKENSLSLLLPASVLGENASLVKSTFSKVSKKITPVVALKNAVVDDQYNLVHLDFKNNFSIEFRAYNDAVAYRFITSFKDSVNIENEEARFNFNEHSLATWSEARQFKNDYQVLYKRKPLDSIGSSYMSILPVMFNEGDYKIMFSEADLFDYPCMFLKNTEGSSVDAVFPKAPVQFGEDGDRSVKITQEANYIARTPGTRSFPWRFFLITNQDEQIIENEMVLKLSSSPKDNFSWVKPGQVTWEWWHDARVYGVDFKSGYNQDTYKYYIDFASAHGIPYILMDEGWAKTTMNPFEPNPTVNLKELLAYGKTKNVRILLWFTWLAVERNFDVFKTLSEWGVAGMKIDFMDRSDQWMGKLLRAGGERSCKASVACRFSWCF